MAHKIGTDANEDVIGTEGDDWLEGLGGNDRLYGKGGNDLLLGGAGNDQLIGGAGADTMYGGAGDDSYDVDNAADVVSEQAKAGVDDGGTDTVKSSLTFSLDTYLEKLLLTGTASVDGAGNSAANTITGNSGNNVLSGQAGSDTINGGIGDDTLIGGADKDYLTGGDGHDTFVFGKPAAITVSQADKVQDFTTGTDHLGFYASDYGLTDGHGLSGSALDPAYFSAGTAPNASGHGQFLYNATSGIMYWDSDGSGSNAAVPVAAFVTNTSVGAQDFTAMSETPAASVGLASADPASETSAVIFKLQIDSPSNEDVVLTYSTVDGTATGGQDFKAVSGGTALVPAGSTTAFVKVDLINDNTIEGTESFSMHVDGAQTSVSHKALPVSAAAASASASIVDESPTVCAVYDVSHPSSGTSDVIPDPSGLAYDPKADRLYISDSEVDETPWFQPTDMWSFGRDGSLKASFQLPFTTEATGLAIDPNGSPNGLMYISDDDKFKIYTVDLSDPTVKKAEFSTLNLGGLSSDPEDVAFDSNNDHLFICNGGAPYSRSIVETNTTGTEVYSKIVLPDVIADPEALAYDPKEDVFYVGGGFSDNVWKVDRNGNILQTINVLHDYYNPTYNTRVNVKDIEVAPASDGSGETHIYVADFGSDKVTDGRLFEIDPGDTAHANILSA